jgi:aminoglycoside phosphotransferase (APT) family kinase protein
MTLASFASIAYTARMKTCNPKYAEQIPDLIQRATGRSPARLIPIPTVPDTIVYEAVLPTTSVIFKAIDPNGRDRDGIGLEAWMCEQVRALGVPAPQILALDTSRSALPTSYFIMEKARGQPLITVPPAQQPAFLRQIGAYLRQIHTVQVEQFGWLDEMHFRQHHIVQGTDPTWREAILKDIPGSLAYFRQTGALDEPAMRSIEQVLAVASPILQIVTKGQLLHGDLGGLHVWVDVESADVTSLVDFGERSAGDPIWDIMRFEWEGVPALIEGYELDSSLQERFWPTFYVYGVLQAIPWARKWHARGGEHTVEWLKTSIREAMPILGL